VNEKMNRENESNPATSSVTMDEPGFFTGLWQTLKGILFSPTDFFSGIREVTGLRDSFAFGILMGSIGSMFGFFWQFLISSRDISLIARIFPESVSTNSIFMGLIIITPLLVLINVIIVTLILHCCLFILQGVNKGLDGTLKVVLYSNATSIYSLIPYIGGLIGLIWSMVIVVIGLREIHQTSTLRAFLALFLPFALLLILGIAGVFFFLFFVFRP